jgi:hypothetical protein
VRGVVTRSGLTAAGISPRLAEREVSAGRWTRVATGIYLPAPPPPSVMGLVQAAATLVDGPFVVSGIVALAELKLRWLPAAEAVHVLVPDAVRQRSSGLIRVTRTTGFESLQTWTRYGARMAFADRAVVDAARHADSLRTARGIVLGAVADGWAGAAGLRQLLDEGQRNGSALARRAIDDAARGCASPPEAELVDALVGAGQPFYVNPELWLDGVLLGSPDVWLTDLSVGGEVESAERHGGVAGVTATYDRHERFAGGRVELVHISVSRIRESARGAAEHLVRRAVDRRALRPPGLVVVPRGPLLR